MAKTAVITSANGRVVIDKIFEDPMAAIIHVQLRIYELGQPFFAVPLEAAEAFNDKSFIGLSFRAYLIADGKPVLHLVE